MPAKKFIVTIEGDETLGEWNAKTLKDQITGWNCSPECESIWWIHDLNVTVEDYLWQSESNDVVSVSSSTMLPKDTTAPDSKLA